MVGGLGLAQQYEVVRLVHLIQGILDFHRDAPRQELGLASATDAGAAFVINVQARFFRKLQE